MLRRFSEESLSIEREAVSFSSESHPFGATELRTKLRYGGGCAEA
jgi:hypothetical protein